MHGSASLRGKLHRTNKKRVSAPPEAGRGRPSYTDGARAGCYGAGQPTQPTTKLWPSMLSKGSVSPSFLAVVQWIRSNPRHFAA